MPYLRLIPHHQKRRKEQQNERLDAPLQSAEDGLPVRESMDVREYRKVFNEANNTEDEATEKPDAYTSKKVSDAYNKHTPNADTEKTGHLDTGATPPPPKPKKTFQQIMDDLKEK
jgi:hypothetical protein